MSDGERIIKRLELGGREERLMVSFSQYIQSEQCLKIRKKLGKDRIFDENNTQINNKKPRVTEQTVYSKYRTSQILWRYFYQTQKFQNNNSDDSDYEYNNSSFQQGLHWFFFIVNKNT